MGCAEGLAPVSYTHLYRKLTRLPAPVRRPVAVRELLQDLQKLFSEEYIRIELPETDRILQIDRTQIEQVLINLIKNAKDCLLYTSSLVVSYKPNLSTYIRHVITSCERKPRSAQRIYSVSYTHLDVYKRQERVSITALGVCDATAHEPCNTSGVNTLW